METSDGHPSHPMYGSAPPVAEHVPAVPVPAVVTGARESAEWRASRERTIVECFPMVRAIAGRMAQRLPVAVDVDELANVGTLGLIDAIDRFDPARGVPFKAYAEIRVRGAIVDALRDSDWAPRTVRRTAQQIEEARVRLKRRLGRDPRREEMADDLGLSPAAYDKQVGNSANRRVMSLDAPTTEEGETRLVDQVAGEGVSVLDQWLVAERNAGLLKAVDLLPEREREVVSAYYQRGMSLKEIGVTLGVTESRVCQLHGRALRRLREHFEAQED